MDKSDLTTEEKKALTRMNNAMKILAKRHWFYATAGQLNLMAYDGDGDTVMDGDGFDQDFKVCCIGEGLDIDGGDW